MLAAFGAEFGAKGPNYTSQAVPYSQVKEAYKAEGESMSIVKFSLLPLMTYDNAAWDGVMTSAGAERKAGPPPRGALERAVESILKAQQKEPNP